jgi:hypothetical protein
VEAEVVETVQAGPEEPEEVELEDLEIQQARGVLAVMER